MQLCVALDLPTKEANIALATRLQEHDIWLKVGFRSYIRDGKEFLVALKQINPNFKIFLDLKLYDIPNTMADAAESIVALDVDMFNVHASSGKRAMSAVMQRISKYEKRPLVIAVTALTSFDEEEFRAVYGESISTKADQFAKDTFESGLDGVVCSAFESRQIKKITSNDFITLTPGIRPFGEDAGDQKRVADVSFASSEMVDFIVAGRPVYNAKDPAEVVHKILNLINQSSSNKFQ